MTQSNSSTECGLRVAYNDARIEFQNAKTILARLQKNQPDTTHRDAAHDVTLAGIAMRHRLESLSSFLVSSV